MSWVKRNLYFLIGSAVAVVLLGLAGFYFYSNWRLNNDSLEKLNAAYAELDKLAKANPNPGNKEIDNIDIARQQEIQIREIIDKERKFFAPIASIPNPTNKEVSKDEFASALRRTVDELAHAANVASVRLPPKYSFSFEAERSLALFAPGSLPPLSVQLGEVKALCAVLYQAKVNSLDNLRRERVSADDTRGPQSDYLDQISVTNSLAVMTPYEVGFHCFSSELAAVLADLANDPHGFVVKAINIEPGAAPSATADAGAAPLPMYQPAPSPGSPPGQKGSLPVLVDEKSLKVTLVLELIKLLPKN